jgi:hypothetical protein
VWLDLNFFTKPLSIVSPDALFLEKRSCGSFTGSRMVWILGRMKAERLSKDIYTQDHGLFMGTGSLSFCRIKRIKILRYQGHGLFKISRPRPFWRVKAMAFLRLQGHGLFKISRPWPSRRVKAMAFLRFQGHGLPDASRPWPTFSNSESWPLPFLGKWEVTIQRSAKSRIEFYGGVVKVGILS